MPMILVPLPRLVFPTKRPPPMEALESSVGFDFFPGETREETGAKEVGVGWYAISGEGLHRGIF